MRLSTNMIFDMSTMSILQQQSRLAHVRQQLATNRKVLTPADDPRAAAQALVVSQSVAVNEQFAANRATVRRRLATEAVELETVTNALQAAKPLLVQAASDALNDADRRAIAKELHGVYQQLLGSANARDGNGNYVFSGSKVHTQTFVGSAGSLSYNAGTVAALPELRVSGSRSMLLGDTGEGVFASVAEGAAYVATADSSNAGSATFANVHVTDPAAAATGDDYTVKFTSVSAVGNNPTTYTVSYEIDNSATGPGADTTVTTSYAIPGAPLTVDLGSGALSIDFAGAPAVNDVFHVRQDHADDNNILNTIARAVQQLKVGTTNAVQKAALRNTLSSTQQKLDNGLDNVLTIRASVGARMQELDMLDSSGSNRTLNLQRTLSGLRDLDYATAASDYAMTQVALQMAQKTFLDIQKLSIFQMV